jgi:extradiol dioxygenase family protein
MWQELEQRASRHGLNYRQSAKRRFAGEITEHHTFFLEDPFYNLLEFKHYIYPDAVFGARDFDLVGDS